MAVLVLDLLDSRQDIERGGQDSQGLGGGLLRPVSLWVALG